MTPKDISLQEDYQKLVEAIEAIGRQREYNENEEDETNEEDEWILDDEG